MFTASELYEHAGYVFFCSGLAFILLGAVCTKLKWTESEPLAWSALALSGVIAGLHQWLNALPFLFGNESVIETARSIILITAFVSLAFYFAFSLTRESIRNRSSIITIGAGIVVIIGLVAPDSSNYCGLSLLHPTVFGVIGLLVRITCSISALLISSALWSYPLSQTTAESDLPSRSYLHAAMRDGIFVLIILVLGWIGMSIVTGQVEKQNRRKLILRAVTAAASVEHDYIASLKGSLADIKNRKFQVLRDQLRAIRAGNANYRYVYIMRQRKGRIVFLADAEPETSPGYSAPGDIYPNPNTALLQSFRTKQPAIEGPTSDAWGCWVTGMVPITDPYSHRVIALLGIDVSADDWQRSIGLSRLYTTLAILIACVMAVSAINNRRNREESAAILAASEHRYRSLFEGSPNAVGIFDTEGHFKSINAAAIKGLGRTEVDVIGISFADIWPEETKPLIGQAIEQVLQDRVYSFEAKMERPDGNRIIWSVTLNSIKDANGRICNIAGIATDITELRRVEREIRESEAKYRALVERSHDVIIIEQNDRIRYMNPRGEQMLGYAKDRWHDSIISDHLDLHIPGHEEPVSGEAVPVAYETMVRRSDGSSIPAEITSTPIIYQGRSANIIVIHDLTQRKSTEDQLRAAHAQNELILASITSVLIAVDENEIISQWNAAAEKAFAVCSDDVKGRPLAQCGVDWDYEAISTAISECLNSGKRVSVDSVRYKRADESEGILGIGANPMQSAEHSGHGVLLLCADISERILMQRQLQQSQKMEAVGVLAAGIAHEINTPTQYVLDNMRFLDEGFTDICNLLSDYERLIRQQADAAPDLISALDTLVEKADAEYLIDEIPKAISQSRQGMEHVAAIVRAMKEYSHPGVTEKKAVDISEVIKNAITMSRNEWKYVADMATNFAQGAPLVRCAPGAINQAILNIIVNAAHAIADAVAERPGEKGVITVTTRSADDSIEICINDTGTGIPDEVKSRIFDPFFTTKEPGKGTGQGLSIAYSIVVEKHKGSISVESETDHGTTFIIRLPFDSDD